MHLVIVAGGLGSRLAPLTNYIPKFLVNVGKETGFVEQIRYWQKYGPKSITVIVHSAYADMVRAYFDIYFAKTGIQLIIKTVDVANGSAHAIMSTCEHLTGESVFFSWCDVLPRGELDIDEISSHSVCAFLNYDHPNRYDLRATESGTFEPMLDQDSRGGIFGVYFIKSFVPVSFSPQQDFVEVLTKYSPLVTPIYVDTISDWGDKPKLENMRAQADHARSFNSVTMHGDLVLKKSLNKQGDSLIAREISWYDELQQQKSRVTRPKHWVAPDATSFVMTKVNGQPIWEVWPILDAEGRKLVLTRLFKQLDELHRHSKFVGSGTVIRDVKLEAFDKLVQRYEEIQQFIKSFGDIRWVNGYRLKNTNVLEIIAKLFDELAKAYIHTSHHSLIHGDLQMSNSMIDPSTLEITLIDPRGYFGASQTYGQADYDIAKLLYSLSGYDLFNYSSSFHIKELNDEVRVWDNNSGEYVFERQLNFDIPKPSLEGCKEIIKSRFTRVHYLWLAVIWIGLAQYIKNDPIKSVAAHYHGLVLAEKILDNTELDLIDW